MVAVLLSAAATTTYRKSLHSIISAANRDTSSVLVDSVVTRGETISNILSEELINPLYYYDLDSIYHLLRSTKKEQNITEIVIINNECRIVHDGTEEIPTFNHTIAEQEHCLQQRGDNRQKTVVHNNHITTSKVLLFGGKPLGTLLIKLSLDETNTNIEGIQQQLIQRGEDGLTSYIYTILGCTILLLLFSLIVAAYLAKRLVKPIDTLKYHAARIGKGDYSEPICTQQKDELSELVQDLENMRLALKSSTVSIDELQREIKERHEAELKQQAAEHKLRQAQKMEGIGQLAAGVAHDLNNILSGLVSLPQLLLMQLPAHSPLRPSLETIRKSGDHAAQIVQDMLTLSKGGVAAEEVVNLSEILREFVQSPECLRLRDTHPGIVIDTKIDDQIFNIKGSHVHLLKLVMNLVNNGADAIHGKGSITIILKNFYTDHPPKHNDRLPPGEYVYLAISDTGSGISPDDLKRVFEPFYSKKKMGRKGTGLGMVIVQNTVKDHDGYIFIESEPGSGTTVNLYFPITREEPNIRVKAVDKKHIIGNGETILVVDDTETQRDIARMVLEDLNYSVCTASSGEQAIEFLKRQEVDLILLDMMMPGISGLETTKQILEINPKLQILLASGYSESGMVRESLKLGARQFIQKPYTIEDLGSRVSNLLNEK